jgi:hypothetical protein
MRANRSFDADTHRQGAARRAGVYAPRRPAGACRSTPTLYNRRRALRPRSSRHVLLRPGGLR